jgi:hypothetical protein
MISGLGSSAAWSAASSASASSVAQNQQTLFSDLDSNGDGSINQTELSDFFSKLTSQASTGGTSATCGAGDSGAADLINLLRSQIAASAANTASSAAAGAGTTAANADATAATAASAAATSAGSASSGSTTAANASQSHHHHHHGGGGKGGESGGGLIASLLQQFGISTGSAATGSVSTTA